MTTSNEGKGRVEALATFAAAARNQSKKPADQGLTATPETAGKAGDLSAEEKDPPTSWAATLWEIKLGLMPQERTTLRLTSGQTEV
jgi:hypothetical protein